MEWLESWLPKMIRILKPGASVYICGDWRSSSAIQLVCDKYLIVRNRITLSGKKDAGQKRIGRITLRIFGSVQFQTITILMQTL